VCVGRLYTMIGSEKLFSKMSDVMGQIFQKILTRKLECISNLLYRFHCYIYVWKIWYCCFIFMLMK